MRTTSRLSTPDGLRDLPSAAIPSRRRRVYMETNKGTTWSHALVLFDPETGKTEMVESDPLGRWISAGRCFPRRRTN